VLGIQSDYLNDPPTYDRTTLKTRSTSLCINFRSAKLRLINSCCYSMTLCRHREFVASPHQASIDSNSTSLQSCKVSLIVISGSVIDSSIIVRMYNATRAYRIPKNTLKEPDYGIRTTGCLAVSQYSRYCTSFITEH
ncbi:hypothetical protein IAQ61_011741, partial [Plenodomus lingam]|uniref:uncharacterized protein n=1 Tax=Leptosphaeria maculans TaxID=5022 RepID=UPI003323EE1C